MKIGRDGETRRIVMVAAVAKNRVIGRDNQLLWRLKTDLQHFRALTLGRPVVMGRKTFDSIGRPLPGRKIIVVSRDPKLAIPGVLTATSIDVGLELASSIQDQGIQTDRIMIAGGGEIYAALMDRADELRITEVDLAPDGDAVFPVIDRKRWKEAERRSYQRSHDDEAAFSFVTYLRASP
jgi:dihydrofolate reductase